MIKYRTALPVLFISLLLSPVFVYAKTELTIRPQLGCGYYDSPTSSETGSIYHYGARVLLGAGKTQKYGLEVSRFDIEGGGDFIALGIVLEDKFWEWLTVSIGTVGYFDYIEDSNNPIGLMTNIGWEPHWGKSIKPYITYRNDLIFSEKTDAVYSLSFGVSYTF